MMMTTQTHEHEKGFNYIIDNWNNNLSVENQSRTIFKKELIDRVFDIELYTVYWVDKDGRVHQSHPSKEIYTRCIINDELANQFIK